MDMNALRSELQKLSALADGWNASDDIPALERDLALEKLRGLYDMLRFEAKPVAGELEPEVEMSVGIDLDDVLALGLIPDAGDEAEVISIASESVVLAVNPEPVVAVAASEIVVEALTPEPEELLVSVVNPEPESTPNPFLETPSVTDSIPKPEPAPQPMPASLFGSEEGEPSRHRHRQRVIMSLYGSTGPVTASKPVPEASAQPKPVASPAGESESEDVFEEYSVETVATREAKVFENPAPAGDIAPDDESFGGEEPADEAPAELDDPTPEAPEDASGAESAGTVLGEVINHKVQTLADAYVVHPDTLSDAVHRASVGDLRLAIGLNDRFLLIRDLFDDDAAACDVALDAFNGFGNLDDCMIHIAENYSWNPDSAGAQFLMDLLERKYA